MTCLIVDDEPVAREILENYIADTPGLTLLASCSSGMSAFQLLKTEHPDILFLDVKMPGLSGMELLRTLEKPPVVILTTAYPDYALEGYDLSVTDYLLKPFSFERFLKAVQKAENKLTGSSDTENVLMIRADKKTWPVKMADILLVESAGDYVTIHTKERKITAHGTLKQMEDQLSPNFQRVHKSWIVSRNAIEYMEGNTLMVHGFQIPIGKTYREPVRDWMQGI
ncbi:LytR/AlgR family response regulator transcription factor [Rhodohalobacter mucosus]|uniref:DNA-binding response regulator n=1 Tax=Rhodohalobacter mucosus TaxID=2079485 RepID=A0A316U1I2_9BACT|nr:LytTR family DNA-binding domain-containing protein [Rhodohalobacter mucosus]PWN06806.1 DNA-binding response regulator [Rhodohalobacter mucosus]